MFENVLVAALASDIVRVYILILDEVAGFFVDRVISQVHAQVVHIWRCRALILYSSETSKTILVNIDTQRWNPIHKDIYTKIKLETIDQVWLMHVPLYDHVLEDTIARCMDCFFRRKLFWIAREKNTLSLAACLRFHNKSSISLSVNLCQELFKIRRKVVSLRKKVVIFGKNRLKAH